VTTEVVRGSPVSRLAEESNEPGVGLLVIATHGHAGLQAVWSGSVTARLIGRSGVPILLLRAVER
jgi:nucleotide-binding universal stress UspA family protein